ncbi:MAG: hypothetical protein Q9175_008154 [Cornicularia normoerica]
MVEGSQSSTSSIDTWLNGQPDQTRGYSLKHSRISNSKRKTRDSDQRLASTPRKRRQLMEISGNAMQAVEQTSGRKLRSSNERLMPATPTRDGRPTRAAQRPIATHSITDDANALLEEDPEQTPTPRQKPPGKTPSFRPRPPNPQFQAPRSRAESSDSAESRDSRKSKSQSPTKRLGDFQFSDMPVDSRAWSPAAIPTDLKDLVKDMERIGKSIGIIPLAVKHQFVAVGETVHRFQCAETDGKHRGKEAEKKATDKATGGLGHDLFWHHVSRIHRATIECLVGGKSEPAWNSEVHSSILRLALQGHWEAEEVWYEDITMARISNKSLVPWNIATGAMQSKMVDYAIVINPSQNFTDDASSSLHSHIIEKLRVDGSASINQTTSDWVRFKPIGVNVETKKGAVGEDEAHVQLGTWLTAHYSRLRQLTSVEARMKLPSSPVLSVQGQRWLLMIACMHPNGRIDLIKELHLGDTGSVVGVYQVTAAIRRIAQWVNDEHRPWFEREVLGM